jgi:hypothetical protein
VNPPDIKSLQGLFSAIERHRFVHVTLYFSELIPNEIFLKIKGTLAALSDDWVKYGRDSWILYTTETPKTLYQKLLIGVPELKQHSIFTFYFDNNNETSGQMEKWVWEWFKKPR